MRYKGCHRHSCSRLAFLVMLTITISLLLPAQTAVGDQAAMDRVDAAAYRVLFRSAATYRNMSDEAAAANQDKTYLRKVLARQFNLTDEECEDLERIALDYQRQSAALHLQMRTVISKFHADYEARHLHPNQHLETPPELVNLQAQEDRLVLMHRDILRDSIAQAAFEALQGALRKRFASQDVNRNRATPNFAP